MGKFNEDTSNSTSFLFILFKMVPSFIDRLPYDILRQIIFYTYTNVVLLDEAHRTYESLLLPPVNASHVCRTWRRALIADRVMWTYISFPDMKLEGIMELLRRSGSLALNVCIRLANWWKIEDSPSAQSMLFTLFDHPHRFKLLRLRVTSPTYEISTPIQFLSYIANPAPQLETFLFFHDDNDDLTLEPLLVTGTLFYGYAPKLKYMHSQLFLHYHKRHSTILHNLTELSLIIPYSFSLSADDVLDLLASSPKLKFIYLHMDTDRNRPLMLQHGPTLNVALPELEKLNIEGYHAHLIKLVLENVTFPSNVEWHFTACDTTSIDHMPNSLPQSLLKVPFTFLHLLFGREGNEAEMILEEKRMTYDTSQTKRNILVLRHGRVYDFADLWKASAMKSVNMFHVTRAVIEFEDSAQFAMVIFPTLLAEWNV